MQMRAIVRWLSQNVLFKKGIFLFCFENKCMSGKIQELKKLDRESEFEILVDFIEPDFFNNEIANGNCFTIN